MLFSDNTSFVFALQKSIKLNWLSAAIIEPSKSEISYGQMADMIERLHLFWQSIGLFGGEKIAICAKNSPEWVIKYLAIVTGGYIAVLIPNNISIDSISEIIRHSGSKVLYVDPIDAAEICQENDPGLDYIMNIWSDTLIKNRGTLDIRNLDEKELFFRKYPRGINPEDICYPKFAPSSICTIMYTSGTTGYSRGAMLSFDFLGVNMEKIVSRYPHNIGDCDVCINSLSHIMGIVMDLITPLCCGMKIVFPKLLTPSCLCKTMLEYKPRRVFAVPLIICSLVDFIIKEDCQGINNEDFPKKFMDSFGGNIEAFLSGGSAIPEEIESLLIDKLHFPLITGYGSTEGGYISLGIVGKYKKGSCGTVVDENRIQISTTGFAIPVGEIVVKDHIFSGYYNNDSANHASFTKDGWLKTGDLGYIDEYGNLFITGRCKDILLTSQGENIYPVEIEAAMDASPYIKESILTQRGEKLHAIVVPDREKVLADGLDVEALGKKIDEAVREASKKLPGFAIINTFELRDEPLERTPKGSLKRFLYFDGANES